MKRQETERVQTERERERTAGKPCVSMLAISSRRGKGSSEAKWGRKDRLESHPDL